VTEGGEKNAAGLDIGGKLRYNIWCCARISADVEESVPEIRGFAMSSAPGDFHERTEDPNDVSK